MSKSNISLLGLILLLTACGPASLPQSSFFNKAPLASPCVLQADTTIILVRDYFPSIKQIDTVFADGLNLVKLGQSWDTLSILLRSGAPALTSLKVKTQGQMGYIPVFTSPSTVDGPFITTSSPSDKKDELCVITADTPASYLIFWQNTLLDSRFLSHKGNGCFLVSVPREAREIERSFIRVYASNKQGIGNDLLIPLNYGNVIEDPKLLKRTDRRTMVLYSLLIDRFFNGNTANDWKINSPEVLPKVDYWGGDFAGVSQKIQEGYFDSLGVNTLWLSPITQNPYDAWGFNKNPKTKFSGYHGYWPIYITALEKRFGTKAELDSLLALAHRHSDNVILDYVAHHMHVNSPTLRAHPEWTTPSLTPDGRPNRELWDEYRLTTWFDDHIPSLDLGRDSICRPLTDSALYWMQNFDFDGFRHDATKHTPEIYWRTLTRKLRDSLPDKPLFQIGETYGSADLISSYVKTGMLDSQFDFNVYDAFIAATTYAEGPFSRVDSVLSNSLHTYGYHNLMGNITGNHDRPRYISLAGGSIIEGEDTKLAGWTRDITVGDSISYNKLSLLHAFITSIPGLPCIYYGDEFGHPGGNDPDNRRWAAFAPANKREEFVNTRLREMLKTRRNNMALMYGDFQTLYVDWHLWVYIRSYLGQWTLTALNKSPEHRTMRITLPLGFTYDGNDHIELNVMPMDYLQISNR